MAAEDYALIDCESGAIAGRLRADGTVVCDDPAIRSAVEAAFRRELLVRDGELVDELGVCFADVETLRPGDTGHWQMVLNHLGALGGVYAESIG